MAICAFPVGASDGIVTVKFSEKNRPFCSGSKGPLNRMVPRSVGEQPEGKVATGHGRNPMTNPASIDDSMKSYDPERLLIHEVSEEKYEGPRTFLMTWIVSS